MAEVILEWGLELGQKAGKSSVAWDLGIMGTRNNWCKFMQGLVQNEPRLVRCKKPVLNNVPKKACQIGKFPFLLQIDLYNLVCCPGFLSFCHWPKGVKQPKYSKLLIISAAYTSRVYFNTRLTSMQPSVQVNNCCSCLRVVGVAMHHWWRLHTKFTWTTWSQWFTCLCINYL